MAPTEEHRLRQRDIPPEVLAVSPVSISPRHYGPRGLSLPLNIIASIVAYIDDTADIARVTRTCRLMYYMTLPQLYERVTLRSYAELRYIDGKPEGFGSGSPFTMALSGLATGNSAAFVQDLCIAGTWPEPKIEEYKMGKVPDNTMLVGIALRAAVDKMVNMNTFRWELDIKPLKTIYQGLAARDTLISLDLRFPSSRIPRPIIVIPSIPNLRKLRISSMDPLCYNDDISTLLYQAKKLENLCMHWSPRMREEAEPSINMYSYFGKILAAKYKLPLKHLGLQNFYGVNTGDLRNIWDPAFIESFEVIDCFGGSQGGAATIFVDETWKTAPDSTLFKNVKRTRISEPSEQHARILTTIKDLEELYLVGSTTQMDQNGSSSTPRTPVADTSTPKSGACVRPSPSPRTYTQAGAALCKQYLHILFTHHGQSLKKVLLYNRWSLSGSQMGDLVSSCPNLEQLAIALSDEEPHTMRILAPFLKNILAIRILQNTWLEKAFATDPEVIEMFASDAPDPQLWRIPPSSKISWIGIGEKIFRLGDTVQVPDEDGRMEWRREAWNAKLEDVQHIDIWRMDRPEI